MFFKDNLHKKIIPKKQTPKRIKRNNLAYRFPELTNNQQLSSQSIPHKSPSHQPQLTQTPKISTYLYKNQSASREKTTRYQNSRYITDCDNFASASTSKDQIQQAPFEFKRIVKNIPKKQQRELNCSDSSEIPINLKQTERVYRQKKLPNNSSSVENLENGLMKFLKKIQENKKIIRNQINSRKENNLKQRKILGDKRTAVQQSVNLKLNMQDVSFKMQAVKQALRSIKVKNQSNKVPKIPNSLKAKTSKLSTEPSSSQQYIAKHQQSRRNKQIKTLERNRKNSYFHKQKQKESITSKNKDDIYSFEQQLQKMHDFMQKGSSSLQKYIKLTCMYHNTQIREQNVESILVNRRNSYKRILNKTKKEADS